MDFGKWPGVQTEIYAETGLWRAVKKGEKEMNWVFGDY